MAVKRTKEDIKFSNIIRKQGYCERCYKESPMVQLQTAHIVGRKYSKTRTDFRNAFCLCAGCHRYFTDNPREFSRFVTDSWAQEYYDEVFDLAQSMDKMDWERRYDFLKEADKNNTPLEELREKEREYWQ